MEDANNQILVQKCRNGFWYTFKDAGSTISPSGVFTMTFLGAGGSFYCANMSGTLGSTGNIFAAMGFGLTNPLGPYDLTQGGLYTGFTFNGKVASGTLTAVRFMVSDKYSDTTAAICSVCSDHPGVNLTFTTSWAPYSASFLSMTQVGWGVPHEASLNAGNAYTMDWEVTQAGQNFNVSVDDISLY